MYFILHTMLTWAIILHCHKAASISEAHFDFVSAFVKILSLTNVLIINEKNENGKGSKPFYFNSGNSLKLFKTIPLAVQTFTRPN